MALSITSLRNRYRYSWILLKELVKTDFKLKYEGSVLGVIYAFKNQGRIGFIQ